jgi:hypothetical protein
VLGDSLYHIIMEISMVVLSFFVREHGRN